MTNTEKQNIYLDYGASSPVSEGVLETVINTTASIYGNPSSSHEKGVEAKRIVEECRNTIKDFINAATEDDIWFTSGATEANSIAIQGFCHYYLHNIDEFMQIPSIYCNITEHEDIIKCCKYMHEMGMCDAYTIPVDKDGKVFINMLDNMLMNEALSVKHIDEHFHPLVIVQGANSEIGTIQDIKAISEIVQSYNGYLMVDITQLLPYKKVDVQELGIDIATDSTHKLGSLKGVGFMYVRNGVKLSPIIFGDQGLRGGTENVVGIASANTAIKELNGDFKARRVKLNAIRNHLFLRMKSILGVHFIGCVNSNDRICNNLAFYNSACKLSAQQIVEMCSEHG